MKFIAIIGSPRKGDTLEAVRRLEAEMKKHGSAEFEYVMLSQVALRDCTGCHNCIMKGRETCREAEKIRELQEKIVSADAVILASPVYNQGVTAIMKKFLDYFTFLWHRPELFGVKFFGVAAGGGMFKEVFQTMKSNVLSWGGQWLGSLGTPHYDALTSKFKTKVDKDFAKQAAFLMKAAAVKELPRPTVARLMSFRMWQMNAALAFSPADREHWEARGWLARGCRYFYPARVNPIANAMAVAAVGIARRFLRGIYVGY